MAEPIVSKEYESVAIYIPFCTERELLVITRVRRPAQQGAADIGRDHLKLGEGTRDAQDLPVNFGDELRAEPGETCGIPIACLDDVAARRRQKQSPRH